MVATLLLVSAIDRRAVTIDGAAAADVEMLDIDAVSTDSAPVTVDRPGPAEYPSRDDGDVPDGDHALSAAAAISL